MARIEPKWHEQSKCGQIWVEKYSEQNRNKQSRVEQAIVDQTWSEQSRTAEQTKHGQSRAEKDREL